ncbi:MAG: [Erysipelotrichaceae bacterium]|nr:[citrate (pro-3S)-lyase] ligase [Erysipelotrichaceae bacterium]
MIISEIRKDDLRAIRQQKQLLEESGLRLDQHLDYSCGLFDDDYNLMATGSCYHNTLRDIAIKPEYRSEALLNTLMSHLIDVQYSRGNRKIFLYTKPDTASSFGYLGFYEIVRSDKIAFMENSSDGFERYLDNLCSGCELRESAAIVMHGNPYTLGHRYLIEKALENHDQLHLFMVSEDYSPIPYSIRKKLIIEGCSDLEGIVYHDCSDYIISSATFPAYFQKSEEDVILSQADIDTSVFVKIAKRMNITERYIGTEKRSKVTSLYNETIRNKLTSAGIKVTEVDRLSISGKEISASEVRRLLVEREWNALKNLVPQTTLEFFQSEEGNQIIERIAQSEIEHY